MLEKQYQIAKKEFRVTGSGCYYKKKIWDKDLVQNKQKELKKTYPYYIFF